MKEIIFYVLVGLNTKFKNINTTYESYGLNISNVILQYHVIPEIGCH